MRDITIYPDASYCTDTGRAGWGCVVKVDGHSERTYGGMFKDVMPNSGVAELAAAANAMYSALAAGQIKVGDRVLLYVDSTHAALSLRDRNIKNPDCGKRAIRTVKTFVSTWELDFVVRQVRAHMNQSRKGRHKANNKADHIARGHMMTARELESIL